MTTFTGTSGDDIYTAVAGNDTYRIAFICRETKLKEIKSASCDR
jgi:hypothetical protein